MAHVTKSRTYGPKGAFSAFNFPVEKLTESVLTLSDAAVVVTHGKTIAHCTQSILSVLGIHRDLVMQKGWPALIERIHPADGRLLQKKIFSGDSSQV